MNRLPKYIFTVVAFLTACGFTTSATSQAKDEFSLILLTTASTLGVRVTVGNHKRWGAMEIKTINKIDKGPKKQSVSQFEIYSVDCANRGVEEIRTRFNLEIDAEKEPRWAEGPINPKYEKGFISEQISHYPVIDFLNKRHKYVLDGADEENKKWLKEAKENPRLPDHLIAAVEFACLVIEKGLPPPVAAAKIMNDAGLTDVKTLECSLSDRQGMSKSPMDLTIRFSEATGFVQAQGFWVHKHLITPEKISLTWKDSNIEINRLNGRGSLTSGEFQFVGPCKVVDKTQRQF
jgi:hypothetical protein